MLAGDLVGEHIFAAGLGEQVGLRLNVLLAGRDPGISHLRHGQKRPKKGRRSGGASPIPDTDTFWWVRALVAAGYQVFAVNSSAEGILRSSAA